MLTVENNLNQDGRKILQNLYDRKTQTRHIWTLKSTADYRNAFENTIAVRSFHRRSLSQRKMKGCDETIYPVLSNGQGPSMGWRITSILSFSS
ncbi:hypothetical protein Gasu2_61340 [Galdieria sulphuraria]|nr:hypothetical protein Gasu2_61340 [Galdieria sulphuraria]